MGNLPLKLGKYRHFKGNYYQVLSVAKHSETQEEYVVYQALYSNPISQVWIRPLSMFLEKVTLPDGTRVSRFTYVDSV